MELLSWNVCIYVYKLIGFEWTVCSPLKSATGRVRNSLNRFGEEQNSSLYIALKSFHTPCNAFFSKLDFLRVGNSLLKTRTLSLFDCS